MALIPASINLTFTSNYVGCHRICWRIQGDPAYDCTTQVNCGGNGASCAAIIGIQVDDASCIPVTYEGYVQACCEDPLSLTGRLPFSLLFTPSASCQGYAITCIGPVGVANIVVTVPGFAYAPPGGTVPVIFSPALGGIAATAYIGNGGVSNQFGSAGPFPFGSGYVDGTYFNVPAINVLPLIGGTGASFTVVVSGGQVVSTTIVPGSNGSGYNGGDTITFNNANLGGSGSGVIVTIYVINTGEIENVVVTNPGSGYSTPPLATVPNPGPPINQAYVEVVMETCPIADISTCFQGPPLAVSLPLGESFVACNSVPYVLDPMYQVIQNGCCNTCTSIMVDKPVTYTNSPADVYYIDCVTKQLIKTILVSGGSLGPVCAVDGSWFVIEQDPVNGITNVQVGIVCS